MAVKAVNDAVHKLQLSLLDGVDDEKHLLAAGSIMSKRDYEDVVTERSIANLCGYPLCSHALPLAEERPRKGRYRISLKEHKVYDLKEMYLYCSTDCVVRSKAFSGGLKEERCLVSNPKKIDEVLRMFEKLNVKEEETGSGGDRGLEIKENETVEKSMALGLKENVKTKVGEMVAGPSDAIEGYVPKMKLNPKSKYAAKSKPGVKPKAKTDKKNREKGLNFNEMDFMSTIIMSDEYSISKTPSGPTKLTYGESEEPKEKERGKELEGQYDVLSLLEATESSSSVQAASESRGKSRIVAEVEVGTPEEPSTSVHTHTSSTMPTAGADTENHVEEAVVSMATLKSSLKSSNSKKIGRSVTWADEKANCSGSDLCEVREMTDTHNVDDNKLLRLASAEACATALSQAVEAISSRESDPNDAVSEAGIIILPRPDDLPEGESTEMPDSLEPDGASIKWPSKPGIPRSDLFDPEDSWYDAPPEGFSLTLSPFATMWMAIFAWMTSSSLAYIYGEDDSFHEEYLSINGREYPRKIVLADGRSSEIKQTLAGCLARALPVLVADLRLPIPVSRLERGVSGLLDTMSFTHPLPAFRMKQWQVIGLLFLDALSVSRIPALTSFMTNRMMLLHKVLDSAHISSEEYDVMKDFVMPLGRAPQFSSQSGA